MCHLGWSQICKTSVGNWIIHRKLFFSYTTRCDDYSDGNFKKKQLIQIALIATVFSVLGALFGYYIGYALNEVAIKIFEFYGYEYSDSFKEKFATGGGLNAWLGILFTAGFTPLPFKLLTISSGIIHFNLLLFIFICIITRGLRFFLVAYLTYKFGEKIGPFLEKQGTKWSILITLVILILAIIILLI